MTNGVTSSTLSSTYANNVAKNSGTKNASTLKETSDKGVKSETKLESLKQQIESGEYKVDVDALAKKMAQELLS